MRRRPSRIAKSGLVAASLAAAAAALAWAARATPPLVLVNETASVPRGLYLRSLGAAQPGGLVAIPQPPGARPYLQTLGVPEGLRLLKRVAAVGGEEVCGGAASLRTPRGEVPTPRLDRRGVRLPAWRGCRRLAPDELLLLGDSPYSFDSRHFGPVRRAEAATYRQVLRW